MEFDFKPNSTSLRQTHIHCTLPDTLFTQQDVQQARIEIKQLKDIMTLKAKSLEHKHMDEQIKKFTDKRCENYTDDKGHMIDSCLERNKRKITIDRLVKMDDNGTE